MSGEDRFRTLLAKQLEMNPRTWAALEERGVGATTFLLIEYSFTAPGRRAANQLKKALGERTTFTAEVLGEGSALKRHWRVVGHTQPSTISLEMLNDWVTFMVTLGAKNGECRFDGWGVQLGGAPPQDAGATALTHGFGTNGHAAGDPAG